MNVLPTKDSINPQYEDCLRLHHCWGWFIVLGGLVAAVGVAAIGSALIATLTSVLIFGWMLVGSGIVQLVNAFMARSWRGFFVYLMGAVVHIIIGALMIERPLLAAAGITLAIALGFFVGGILRIAFALVENFPGRAWVLLNGFITLLLGIAIWRQWPESTEWVIGLFVGIDLIFNGISWMMLGLVLKAFGDKLKTATTAPSQEPAGTPS